MIRRQVAMVGRVYSSDERMLGGLCGETGPGVEAAVTVLLHSGRWGRAFGIKDWEA